MAIDPKYDITQPLDDPQNYSGMSSNVLFGNEMRSRPNNSMMMSRQGGILGGSNNVGMLGAENAAAQAKRIFDERQMRDRESIERLRANIGRTEQFLADTPPPRPYTRADALIDRLRAFGTGRGGSKTRRIFDSLGRGRQMSQENALLRRQQMSDYLGSQSQLMEGYNQLSGLENQVGQDQIVANWIDTLPDAQLRALYYGNPELARDEYIKSVTDINKVTPSDITKLHARKELLDLSDQQLITMGTSRAALMNFPQGSTLEVTYNPLAQFNEQGFSTTPNSIKAIQKGFVPAVEERTASTATGLTAKHGELKKADGLIVSVNKNDPIYKNPQPIVFAEGKGYGFITNVTKDGTKVDEPFIRFIGEDPDLRMRDDSFYKATTFDAAKIQEAVAELNVETKGINDLLNYVSTVGSSPVGFNRLVNQFTKNISTFLQKTAGQGSNDLTKEQLKTAQGQAQLNGLLGQWREDVVGPGVMTEYDAQRVISALGGDFNYTQNPQAVATILRDILKEKYAKYKSKHDITSTIIDTTNDILLSDYKTPDLITIPEDAFDLALTMPDYLNTLKDRKKRGVDINLKVLELAENLPNIENELQPLVREFLKEMQR